MTAESLKSHVTSEGHTVLDIVLSHKNREVRRRVLIFYRLFFFPFLVVFGLVLVMITPATVCLD